jgi:hypothetical protein
MKPGDIAMWRDDLYGHHRLWEIKGVFLGAEGQESLIQLQSISEKPGIAFGNALPVLYVPEPMVRSLTVYSRADDA